jgi:hypothetical protein
MCLTSYRGKEHRPGYILQRTLTYALSGAGYTNMDIFSDTEV